ncbi:MAG: ATP-grasp fold amidoligase family protein [Subdoligranulum sp.]
MRDPNSDVLPEKPIRFDEMKKIAAVLSKGLPHLRVDFYCANADWWIRDFYDTAGGRQRDRASGTGGSNASAGMVHIK